MTRLLTIGAGFLAAWIGMAAVNALVEGRRRKPVSDYVPTLSERFRTQQACETYDRRTHKRNRSADMEELCREAREPMTRFPR